MEHRIGDIALEPFQLLYVLGSFLLHLDERAVQHVEVQYVVHARAGLKILGSERLQSNVVVQVRNQLSRGYLVQVLREFHVRDYVELLKVEQLFERNHQILLANLAKPSDVAFYALLVPLYFLADEVQLHEVCLAHCSRVHLERLGVVDDSLVEILLAYFVVQEIQLTDEITHLQRVVVVVH